MSPNPRVDYYDALGLRYEQAFGHNTALHAFIQRALKLLPANATVLDMGCGTGKPTASAIAASGHRVHGIDFSPVMIDLSRKQVPAGTFELVNMLDYNPAAPFDAACAIFSTFEFSREQMSGLTRSWADWIVAGGFVFVGTIVADDLTTEPGMFDADGLYARGMKHAFMGEKLEVALYTKSGWKALLEQAGFEIVHVESGWFRAPAEAGCDDEPETFIIAQKLGGKFSG